MNEVAHIHLGRQQFTISVEAHHELRKYLSNIQDEVQDTDVMEEVELRMSELLSERGIKDGKVVIAKDVTYLKEQLGQPKDFSEDSDVSESPEAQQQGSKRLFRDPENAIVAGVASGVARYFGLEAALVRVIFVLLTIFGGSGIVIYLILWLALPPAVTTSEKLQMRGKPVTLGALKESVGRAEISSKAQRVSHNVATVINRIFYIISKLVGVGIILAGVALFCGTAVTKAYMLLHGGKLFQENLYPVGSREKWLMGIGMGLVALVAIFLVVSGVAILKRKWPVRGWIIGGLVGIFLVGSIAAVALAADAAPRVRERYQESLHTTAIKNIRPFNKVVTNGKIDIAYVSSPNYSVNVHYSDNPDLSKLKIEVRDNILYVDSSKLDKVNHCTMLCLFPRYNMTVQVYAPNIQDFVTPPKTDIFYPAPPALN